FFFQAEDGIRDFHVTGVQTCALPIYDEALQLIGLSREEVKLKPLQELANASDLIARIVEIPEKNAEGQAHALEDNTLNIFVNNRSEERRVGKERRSQI